jgi:hypothetical protein
MSRRVSFCAPASPAASGLWFWPASCFSSSYGCSFHGSPAGDGIMASANFQSFDRTLRRMYMMNLVETIAAERDGGFKASLVVNPRTGLPLPERAPAPVRQYDSNQAA